MNETKELAQFITETCYQNLTDEVVKKAKGLILDQLGCQIAFATLPWNKAIYKYVSGRKGAKEESTITYYGLRTTVEDAAFANAIFGHGFEMDDTEMHTLTHPGSVVIPAALAVGETIWITGKEFLTAVVVGYDAMLRAGMAARNMINRSFHGTAVAGPFGAAAATGKLLNFDTDTMTNTLGIAGSECSGIAEYTVSGGSVKRLHAGFASHAGVRAALLAQIGLTGPSAVLEGEKGFCQAFADEYYLEEITADLGKQFRILWTGTKPYCCCAAQHTTIDAVSAIIKERPVKPDDIEEITVAQSARDVNSIGNIIEPKDIVAAQFSGRFGVALRLIKGSNGFNDYTLDNLKDPEILNLAKKVSYVVDREFGKLPPGSAPARVTVKLRDGTIFKKQVDFAKGTTQNPMTNKELQDKFRELVATVLPDKSIESIIRTVMELEETDNINELSSLLVAVGETIS